MLVAMTKQIVKIENTILPLLPKSFSTKVVMAPASEETKRKNDTLIRLFQKLIGTYTDAEGRNLPENVDSTRRTIVAAANLLIAQLRNLSADFDIRAAEEIANKCMLLENEVNDFEVLIQEYYDRHEMTIPRLYGGRKVEGKVVTIEGPNYRKALLHEEKGHARKVWGDDQYDPSKSRYQSISKHLNYVNTIIFI
ncbi:hypothetical protein M3Y97_01169000 [Aphelenchoides bicaudatus]|nr:hypothetical protein M3Y97_01169000 [Aphelenchoides bicaudatus]